MSRFASHLDHALDTGTGVVRRPSLPHAQVTAAGGRGRGGHPSDSTGPVPWTSVVDRHFASKAILLDEVVESVMSEIDLDAVGASLPRYWPRRSRRECFRTGCPTCSTSPSGA